MNKPEANQKKSPHAATCNIDAHGRRLRLVAGGIVTLVGLVLLLALLWGLLVSIGWWVMAVATIFAGLFQIYEGWAGWCALRAMGFRTPV